jgi:PTS system galactitol-specific IIC component
VLVPIAILLSIILPGNQVILFADLAVIPFVVALAAPVTNGNVLRMVIIGTVTLAIGFGLAGGLAPLFTSAAASAGFKMPAGATQITSIVDSFLWVPWMVIELVRSIGWAGLGVILVATVGAILVFQRNVAGWETAAGAADESEAAAE